MSTPAKSAEVPARNPCPCDSGLPYRKCCKKKDFKWMQDESGDFSRAIPISHKAGRILESAKSRYKRIFGREPKKSDPVFLERYLALPRDLQRETEDAMLKAGLSPELIFAYRKTGRLLTAKNARLIPHAEVKEWNAAIEEFRKIQTGRMKEPRAFVEMRALVGEFDACIILLGYFLENGISRNRQDGTWHKKGLLAPADYWIYCASKCYSALRSIDWMFDKDRGMDAMPLIRMVYECYLHMRFIEANPEKLRDLVDARLGLRAGTHEFAKNSKGVPDRRSIVELETGKRFEGHISAYRMAEASCVPDDIEVFPYLYEYLSEFVHPSVEHLPEYLGVLDADDGEVDARLFEACVYGIAVACMVLDFVRTSGLASKAMRADLTFVLKRISNRAIRVLGPKKSQRPHIERLILARWEYLKELV